MILELTFPVPGEPPSINSMPTSRGGRIGWSKKRQAWRDTARMYAVEQPEILGLGPTNVQVTIPFRSNRTRDPHNYVGTVVKWIVDGLVKAGCWPDDNPLYVTVIEPVLVVGDDVTVTFTPREEPAP